MSKLTREQIEEWRRSFGGGSIDFHALCDMALQSLEDAEDAARYRWLRDETIQDARDKPFGVAIAILSEKLNTSGYFDIKAWGVAWSENADAAIDAARGNHE